MVWDYLISATRRFNLLVFIVVYACLLVTRRFIDHFPLRFFWQRVLVVSERYTVSFATLIPDSSAVCRLMSYVTLFQTVDSLSAIDQCCHWQPSKSSSVITKLVSRKLFFMFVRYCPVSSLSGSQLRCSSCVFAVYTCDVPSTSAVWLLTLWRQLLPYGYSYKASYMPDRVKPSFVIFDIRALWRSGVNVRVPECQKLQITA